MKQIFSFVCVFLMALTVNAMPHPADKRANLRHAAPVRLTPNTKKLTMHRAPQNTAEYYTIEGVLAVYRGLDEATNLPLFTLILEDGGQQVGYLTFVAAQQNKLAGAYVIAYDGKSSIGENPVYGTLRIICEEPQKSQYEFGKYYLEIEVYDEENCYQIGHEEVQFAAITMDETIITLTDAIGCPGSIYEIHPNDNTEGIIEDYVEDYGVFEYVGFDNNHYADLIIPALYDEQYGFYIDYGIYECDNANRQLCQIYEWGTGDQLVNQRQVVREFIYLGDLTEQYQGSVNVLAWVQTIDGNVYYISDDPSETDYFYYDDPSSFTASFNNVVMDDSQFATTNMVYLDADGDQDQTKGISLVFLLENTDPNYIIPAGTYTIDHSSLTGTVLGSQGYDGEQFYFSMAYTSQDGQNVDQVWYIVRGTVTVSYPNGKLNVTLTGTTFSGHTVSVTITDNAPTALSSVIAEQPMTTQKVLRNGRMEIIRAGVHYDLQGAKIR